MILATFRLDPEVEIDVEQIAAHATDWTIPCIWVANADFDAVNDVFAADPSVESIIETLNILPRITITAQNSSIFEA